jgi:hypothetical protein
MFIIEDPTVIVKVKHIMSNYDQYHHQFRWLTFGFPATDDISHVTFILFAFECVPHMGRSQQIKYLRLYFNVLVFKV